MIDFGGDIDASRASTLSTLAPKRSWPVHRSGRDLLKPGLFRWRHLELDGERNGAASLALAYGPWHERYKMCTPDCTSPTSTTTYFVDTITGSYSEKVVSGSTTTWRDYIMADGQIVALRSTTGSTVSTVYVVPDHLGSTSVITDTSSPAAVTERDSYDAWGRRRNLDQTPDPTCTLTSQTNRGYTAQEMLDSQCLINMNARVYDPTLGRFSSADDIIPEAFNSQACNRYAYVLNNPLALVDPTGRAESDIPPEQAPPTIPCGGSGKVNGVETTLVCANRIYQTPREPPEGLTGGGGGGGGGDRKRDSLKKLWCQLIPSGRVQGVSGSIGGIGSEIIGGEIVLNYNTGQASLFGYGGVQGGWNGGAQATVYSGLAYGLTGNNSNYSGGFTTLSGGYGFGGFVSNSSGGLIPHNGGIIPTNTAFNPSPANPNPVTVAGMNFSLSAIESPTGTVGVTQYTNPTQLPPDALLNQINLFDLLMMLARIPCNG